MIEAFEDKGMKTVCWLLITYLCVALTGGAFLLEILCAYGDGSPCGTQKASPCVRLLIVYQTNTRSSGLRYMPSPGFIS